ncbi:chemotaxis protein [Candidatus Liberibacter africanus]|uniref:Chemotaxis protein n=1 Tax=Candidatus Liberibacter africanus PTSAPSY TaxID=1277257 RepID=A0A0G3I765_LIBAF|nr:chemotaxis protein [Candidatus Liberibacter africanus]AKK20373.1 chemotaxis protein [Candidatus Liberibacter africanus PTSAPSY]QTP64110.1 chemotaxis protein [Candidatus Liberibacter africanus]
MYQKCFICMMIITMDVFVIFAMDQDLVRPILPYQHVRLLQNSFNKAVRGDVYSQKKNPDIIKEVGLQLRATQMDVFADHRNVDAVWIYTIISQDLSILDDFLAKDTKGYFDRSIVDVLKKYFSGEFKESLKAFSKINDKNNTQGITPYLYLLMGNATTPFDPQQASKLFDYVRLTSSGTFLEEISLRCLLEITKNQDGDDRVFSYIRSYITQFYYSMYQNHFSSVLLHFLLHNQLRLTEEDIVFTMSFLSLKDQSAIYLKLARNAVISGKSKIGFLAIKQLKKMSGILDYKDLTTVQLYENILNIPFVDIIPLQRSTYNIPYDFLTQQDRHLKKYAEVIMSEMGKSLINIDFDHINKNFISYKKEHEHMTLNIKPFIHKNIQKIKEIDHFLEDTR